MKRALMLLALALLALALLIPAQAALSEALNITLDGVPASIDLDGDGASETVACVMMLDDSDCCLQLQVSPPGGAAVTADIRMEAWVAARAVDLNGDGLAEILISGDIASDDYFTWCFNYVGGRLKPVLFADIRRGENGDGYYRAGYGLLEDADPAAGTVTLSGSQDVLGTWFGSRTLKLTEDGLFEIADDGLWRRDFDPTGDGAWEYGALTARAPVPCRIDGADALLSPGDQIMITGSDKSALATFVTRDGRAGELAVSENYERGWGWMVDGVSEEELFEYVPYAD